MTPQAPPMRGAMITAILCFGSLGVGVAGCRQSATPPAAVTILDPEWSQPDEMPRAEREAQEFTEETGVAVKHLPVPETSLGQLDLLRGLLGQGASGPDVVGIDVIWPGILADDLVDLRPDFSAELAALDPDLVAGYTVSGKVVAVPYHAHVGVLAYRTDLLREYGYAHPPKTWDELEKMALRIQSGERAKGKKDFWGYTWQGAAAESLTCNALEWQVADGGGRIIEDDKTISVNNPAAIHAWQRAARWVGWISPPGVVAYRELDTMNVWNTGGTAFRRTWQWKYRLTHWEESAMAKKTGFTSMPGGVAGRVGTLGGIGLGVSRFSVHRKEAVALIRFLVDREHQSGADRAPSAQFSPPELYELPAVLDPHGESNAAIEERGKVISRPSNITGAQYEDVTKAYIQAVHSVLVREKSGPNAAAALEKQLASITGFKTGPPKKAH